MKTSLICTVLNEETTISKFLQSVSKQSKLPDEIIITDGGSSDKTLAQISSFKSLKKVKVISKKGNRSVGRNEAIKKATGEIILVSDAGCVLDKNWVKEITNSLVDKKVDVAGGYYKPVANNIFEKCLGAYTSVMPDKIDRENFLPSSRSVAFRKSAWKKVKGYPEELDTCEDLVFDKKLKEARFKFVFASKAVVYWPQRHNLIQAFWQFFTYARGDGLAKYFRSQTPYLFLRYIFAAYLVALIPIMRSVYYDLTVLAIGLFYVIWSVKKNYKYVKDVKAFFYLPLLQFSSDLAVISGITTGFLQSLSLKSVLNPVKNNKILLLIILVYSSLMFLLLQWGIPNLNHPFNYAMDEWHFSQALRTFVKDGTGSVSGAASIPFYHIVSSIIFLIPFYVLHIVNPLAIKSTVSNLPMQHVLFEILRLHTLFYGILSMVLIYNLLKNFIKSFASTFTALFVFNPIWISLTNYYKYDITLSFWIISTLFLLVRYFKTQNFNYYIFAGIACGLALATKFTAAPLFIAYFASYLILSKKINYKILISGVVVTLLVTAFVGVPDMIFGKGSYYQLLSSTLIQSPKASANYVLGYPAWFFLLVKEFPSVFGYFLCVLFYANVLFWGTFLLLALKNKTLKDYKLELTIFVTGFLFLLSTVLFGIDGGGNRSLVLIPFMILLPALLVMRLSDFGTTHKKIIFVVLLVGLTFQAVQSASWISVKFFPDPREVSSIWIQKDIPAGSSIGIENIPIYQMLPDFVLKEYYFKQHDVNFVTRYNYDVISSEIDKFPKYVVITNDFDNLDYVKDSPKKDLVNKLLKDKYKRVKVFYPDLKYYNVFADKRYFVLANIMAIPVDISVYEKQ